MTRHTVSPQLADYLRGQIQDGALAEDIGAARLDPRLSEQIRVNGFHVPRDLSELAGPEHGAVEVPAVLADYPGERANLDDAAERARLYRRLLNLGDPTAQRTLLHPDLLAASWIFDLADPVVMKVWSDRFPEQLPAR
jgi:hypothetical protein